jgi:regulator of replication initiation timing
MSLLAVPIIAVLALFLVLILSILGLISFNRVKTRIALLDLQVQSNNMQVNELQGQNAKIQQTLDGMLETYEQSSMENAQVSKQLEHRIKVLQQQFIEQQQALTQWQESQGQDKFYNRAFKLAAKGADIDEIISECELPRAEVEMLLSVYQQRTRS